MNPARFKHRIEIYGDIEYKNELNAKSKKHGKIKSIWSDIIPQTGALQRQQADTILTNVTHKIIVRYSAIKSVIYDANAIEPYNIAMLNNMEIKYRNHTFEVKYAINPYFKNETVEIFVMEVLR